VHLALLVLRGFKVAKGYKDLQVLLALRVYKVYKVILVHPLPSKGLLQQQAIFLLVVTSQGMHM
jgi:hypothetical protein